MGFFSKVVKSFSGREGQIEVNIINALDHIKKSTSKRDIESVHSKDKQFFWWFAYGIATTAGSLTNQRGSSDSAFYSMVFNVVEKALSNYNLRESSGGTYELETELMQLGSQYMYGVKNFDKHQYMSAIDSVIGHMRNI